MTSVNSTDSPGICDPYEAIAPIYDELMLHVEYDLWAEYIHKIIIRQGKNPAPILELACGTGKLASYLHRYGYKITGYDRSPAMIKQAQIKYNDFPDLSFSAASFFDFPRENKYDAIICLYDSINYLMTVSDLVRFLERIKDTLNDGGLFIFDVCTRYNSATFFRNYHDDGKIAGYRYFRHSDYDTKTHIHINRFQLYKLDNPSLRFSESHQQMIYSLSEIRNAVRKSGLKILGEYNDMTFRRAGIRSLRIHFVTGKTE